VVVAHLLISIFSVVQGHSWLEQVGANGVMRDYWGATDLQKERYYCPLATLDLCQPAARYNVTLTADAMNPCDSGLKSDPEATVGLDQNLYLLWAANGHAGSQSLGTCVYVGITPYADNPPASAFTTMAACLPFSHDNETTDASLPFPPGTTVGEYTVFWLWNFTVFWFSSCADIIVLPAGQDGTLAPTTNSSLLSVDCTTYPDPTKGCVELVGLGSFCKSWQQDACGKSHCQGDIIYDDSMCVEGSLSTSLPTTITRNTDNNGPYAVYYTSGCGSLSDADCVALMGPGSYCHTWQVDACNRSVCHGDSYSGLAPMSC